MAMQKINKTHSYSTIIYLFLLSAVVINDLPLQSFLGTLGASPMWFFSAALFILIIFKNKFVLRHDFYSKAFFVFFCFTFLTSLIQLLYYLIDSGQISNVYNDSLLTKLFLSGSYYFVYYLFLSVSCSLFPKTTVYFFAKLILFIVMALTVVLVIEFFAPQLLSVFHLSMENYGPGARLRLLSPEPSIAAYTFNVFLLLAIIFWPQKLTRLFLIGILITGNVVISSKSSVALVLVSVVIVFVFNMSIKQKIKFFIFGVIALIIGTYVIVTFVLPALFIDIDNFTSVSTRLITGVWAIISLWYFPLGEGYSTYTVYYYEPLTQAIKVCMEYIPFKLNLDEIDYMMDTGKYLTAKSGVLFSIIQCGFFAVVFYFVIFNKMFKDISSLRITAFSRNTLRVITWYSILSISFFINTEVLYAFLMPFVTVSFLKYKAN